jgi:hypothetical protein
VKKNNKDKNVKQFLGLPMRWDHKNIFKNLWNKEDDRIFPPKQFGIGWSVNFHALFRETGMIKPENKKK